MQPPHLPGLARILALISFLALPLYSATQPKVVNSGEPPKTQKLPSPEQSDNTAQPTGLNETLRQALELRLSELSSDVLVISPDGKHLAYSLRQGGSLKVIVMALPDLTKAIASVQIGTEAASEYLPTVRRTQASGPFSQKAPADSHINGKNSPRIERLRWISNTRLAVTTNANFPEMDGGGANSFHSVPGALYAFDLDGSNGRLVTNRRDLYNTHTTVGSKGCELNDFYPTDERHVVLRTSQEDTLQINTRSGKHLRADKKVLETAKERERTENNRARTLCEADIERLAHEFPRHRVDWLGADQDGSVFGLRIHSVTDPGFLGVYVRAERRLYVLARCQPGDDPEKYVSTRTSVDQADGLSYERLLIHPKLRTPGVGGLVVICPEKPRNPTRRGYDNEVMALVDMGYSVLELGGFRNKARAPNHNFIPEAFELLRKVPSWTDPLIGPVPKEKVLWARGQRSCELGFLALYFHNDIYDSAVFFEQPMMSTVSETQPLLWKSSVPRHPEDEGEGATRQALCYFKGARSGFSQDKARQNAVDFHRELIKHNTHMDIRCLPWEASALHHVETLLPIYEEIASFLHVALRKTRTGFGTPTPTRDEAKN